MVNLESNFLGQNAWFVHTFLEATFFTNLEAVPFMSALAMGLPRRKKSVQDGRSIHVVVECGIVDLLWFTVFEISDYWCNMNMNTLLWLIAHIYMHVYDCICVMCFFKSRVRICYLFILHMGARVLRIPTTMFQTYRKGATYLALWLWFYWGKWLTHIWGDGWARHSCCLTAGLIEWIKMTGAQNTLWLSRRLVWAHKNLFQVSGSTVCFKHPEISGKPTVSG